MIIFSLKKYCLNVKINTEFLFLSCLLNVRRIGTRYQAYARREGLEYTGLDLHNSIENATKEGQLKACEWYCYEQEFASVVGEILSGKIVAQNQEAIALLNQVLGDRFLVFRYKDRKCLLTRSRLIEMEIGEQIETSFQQQIISARKLTDDLFICNIIA